MPFYEYQCKNCGHELEAMQKISEGPLKKCPHCGKSQLQRLMSAPVFRLKGSGWYETDFKDDKDKKKNLADQPESDTTKEATVKAEKDASPEAASGAEKPAAKESDAPKKAVEKADKPAADAVKKGKLKQAAKKSKPKPAAKYKAAKTRKR